MKSTGKPERIPDANSLAEARLDEIVFGLCWDSPRVGGGPVNLDAMCVLFDGEGKVLEIVDAAHPRAEDDSVIHTGDSPTGASPWDDERIFVFLSTLRPEVSTIAFIVTRATEGTLQEFHAAFCHISDRVSEKLWAKFELPFLSQDPIEVVAMLKRRGPSWEITEDSEAISRYVGLAMSSPAQSSAGVFTSFLPGKRSHH